MPVAFLTALPREVRGAALEGLAPVLDGLVLALDGLVPVLDGLALDLAALLAFDLLLPKLILGSFCPIGSRNIIR